MQDLQEVTHDLHYENFRAQQLKKTGFVFNFLRIFLSIIFTWNVYLSYENIRLSA